jgi:hypothetical protein
LARIGQNRAHENVLGDFAFYVSPSGNPAIYFRNRHSLVIPAASHYIYRIQMQFFRSLAGLVGLSPAPRLREVGFWCPMPSQAWEGPPLTSRPHPHEFVDRFWSFEEREQVITYLLRGKVHTSYYGHSVCRLCGLTDLGNKDLTDGVWVWPDGFAHYLQLHAVKPPQEFVDHVLREMR